MDEEKKIDLPSTTTSGGKKRKDRMQEDFTPLIETELPKQIQLAKEGKLTEAIENLFALEKQTRQAEDYSATSKLAIAIVRLCYEAKDWNLLIQNLHVLVKRRGQLRSVVQDFVREAMTYLDHLDKDTRMQLLETLRQITEGKMYVEIERARLTRILAKIREEEGKVAEAADILQEIQVETFGQMDRKEKTEFILEQMRLCIQKGDWIKVSILSNKISRKSIKEPGFEELKQRFYHLMIQSFMHDRKYVDVCKAYQEMYDTPAVQQDENLWKKYLEMSVIFVCLAPFNNEQSDLANRINQDKKLLQLPMYKKMLGLFLTKELMQWPVFEQTYRSELNRHKEFTDVSSTTTTNPNNNNTNTNTSAGGLWPELKKRVVEHNIRVAASYYSRITMKRLSQLLDMPSEESEKFVSDLVVSKSIFAKIDRPRGIVNFTRSKEPNEALNEWSHNVSDLLNLLEKTTHLIHRENMVHKIDQ